MKNKESSPSEEKTDDLMIMAEDAYGVGYRDGLVVAGFISAFEDFPLSEESILQIILRKMELSYNKEYIRMQLGSNERNTKNMLDAGVDPMYGVGEDFE